MTGGTQGRALGRRSLIGGALAALPGLARAAAPPAPDAPGDTPTGRLQLLVGAAPGSPPDLAARSFIPFLERHLPRTEIGVTNMQGGAGLAAFHALAAAPAGAGMIGWVSSPALPARMVESGEDLLARMRLLGSVMKEPIAIVSPAKSPLNSVADIIARSGDATQAMPLGTPPAGSPSHLTALRLQAVSGTKLNIVPFPSAGAVRQAVLAGNVAAAAIGLSDILGPLRDGRLVGLAVSTAHRADAFPDIPALREAGLPLTAAIQRGIAVPAAMPGALGARIAGALAAIVNDPEFAAQGSASGFSAHWEDGEAWSVTIRLQQAELARLWQDGGWS